MREMEGRRNTPRVRVRAWTPASGYSSPPSPVSSQLSWDEGRDKDFQSQMDENGIIGLRETQGELEQEDEVLLEEEEDMFSDVGTPEPEDGPPPVLGDLSCHLSELLDSEPLSQPIDDSLSPAHNDVEYSVSLEDWSDDDIDDEEKLDEEDQESFIIHRPIPHSSPDRDLISEIPNDETEEIKMHGDESHPFEMNIVPQDNWMESYDVTSHEGINNNVATLETRTLSQNSCDERSHVSSSPSFKSAPQTHIHPHVPELTLQDEASNCGIEDETFEELAGCYGSRLRHSRRTYQPVSVVQEEEEQPASALRSFESENGSPEFEQKAAGSWQSHHQPPVSTLREINSTPQVNYSCFSSSAKPTAKDSTSGHRRHHRPSKTSHTDLRDVRKGQLSHPLPDFSKVEPRVRFPKSRYTPPKSRKPPPKEDSKPEAPVVFKSPADIVREALLSNSEGPLDSIASTDSQKPLNSTMPMEFRCPLQASAMVQQLQEDYNRLLTKYAEAENTIDRLRLEAKVSLHSDPPKPSQLALSGFLKEGSKVMTLSFPQAQRAELGTDAVQPTQQRLSSATRGTPTRPSSVDSFISSWRESPAATPLTEALSKQMARFQLQVNEFEKLLKTRRLKPSEQTQEYKELQRRVKREVSKAKQKAYDELYTRLDTREGEKDLYRLARQRDRDGKDVQQVRVIKDRDGRVLTSEESVQRRWKEYFEELMNEENEREKRVEGVNSVEQKVDKIRKDEVRKALKRMKSGKAVGPDDIPVEVWKCLGEAAVEFLANLFNRVLESERMPEEWRRSVLVPIFKNKGDVQSCSNYRGIKLMSHTMKVWERVVEARLRKVVEICEQQYGFMPRKSTTDAIFALSILMEKYRDGQKELHCVFVDLEKAYDRVPREELWYCMRKSGVAEKYVRVVQDMYERSRTVVRCAVGQTEEFNVEVGLHQGSALSPFLFAMVMDQLSEEVRQESPWTMMFADDIVICSESREQVEENLERWRFALERRGMKVSRSKTEYMCVNEREGSGTVRLQGEEVKKVQEFKYLGSTVQSNGECGKEVKKRVQAGWNGWRKVSGVLCDQKISARIKGKVYRTVVRAAMLYGLETVSLRKRQESELEGLSRLTKGQESMEKAYLAAREKHQQLQRQTEWKSGPFDPSRELESLIFQSGIQLEELKEWIEQPERNQLLEATPSDPPRVLQPCASVKETEPQPENPACAAHAEVMVGLEVSSVSGESDGEREKVEEDMLPSVLRPLNHKHQRVEKDFSKLMDHYQDFRDFSKLLDRDQAEVDQNSMELRNHSPHPASIDRINSEQQWRSKNKQHSDKPLQPLPVADSLSGPYCSSHVCNSMETLPEAPVPASALPRKQSSGRSAAGSIKSHSSQGKRAAMGRRASKENDRALRAQLQDGVVTPETDSGFVGSESSRLTPAVQSPVQQRTAVRATRPSVAQEKCRINPESSAPAHTQPYSDPSRVHAIASGGAPGSLGRRGEARVRHIPSSSASSSPLRWPSTSLQPWPSGGISELEQQSECAHSLSEDGTRQGNQHTRPSNQDPSYVRSSSLTAPYHHGDHLKAQSSGHLANHHEAIQSLQTEVHKLREHLEGTLRGSSPLHRVRAPPSPSKDIRDHTRSHTSTPHPQQGDFRSLERKTASKREPRETVDTVKSDHERTIPRRRSASVPRFRPEPNTSTDSEHTQSEDMTPKHIPASPVMAHTTRRARAETGRIPKTHSNRQKRSVSADRSDVRNAEAEGRGRPVPLCLSCLARRNRSSGYQERNIRSPSHTRYYSNHCPLCGATKTETVSPSANQGYMQKETRPMRSTHMQTGGVYLAVAPPTPVIGSASVLQCVPVVPSVLYYSSPVVSYQKALYISPSDAKGYRGHRSPSHSVDAQRSLNHSLGRAIAAVSSVREMSERMVRSLSSGLHPLAKSCTY
ncbi:hypothetical protein QTP86_016105 [Hemibagrus guttatus]|nr:hypothetical protein QTP86_016105 [Hemibagrus guttatus]